MIGAFSYDWTSGVSVVKHWLTTAAEVRQRSTVKKSLTVQIHEKDKSQRRKHYG